MEISDGHECLFSEISTDGSFESGDSDISKDDFLFDHIGEPEYKAEELKSMEFPDDNKSNSNKEENDVNSSKQKNLDWFKSSHCTIMPISIECKCCKELKDIDLWHIISF